MFEDLKFDLQLFADGTTAGSDTAGNVGDTNDTGDDDQYAIDDKGNLIIISGGKEFASQHRDSNEPIEEDDEDEEINNDDEEEEGTEDSDDEEEEVVENNSTDVQKFPVKIDGKIVEVTLEELQNGYMRQADYTTKTQKLAQERNQIKSQTEQKPVQEQTNQFNPKEFYEGLTNVAKEAVSQELGEEFDEFNPTHITALALKVNHYTAAMAQDQNKRSAVEAFEIQARNKEPENFDAIYEYAKVHSQKLPHDEYVALQKAFNDGDVKIMDKFFDDMTVAYYKSIGVVKPGTETKPEPRKIEKKKSAAVPPVEKAGTGDTNTKPKIRDATQLSKMTTDEKSQWLIDMGIV